IFEPFRVFLAQRVERIKQERAENNLPHRFTFVEFWHKVFQNVQSVGFCCGLFCGLFMLVSDIFYSRMFMASGSFSEFWTPSLVYNIRVFRCVMLVFCCGMAGSFSASLGDSILQWLDVSKELKAKQLSQKKNEELENKE
ncbi:MAG: hypothetical protein LBC20_04290, partial [Planctomycetaceae bacterium]|nr:hypothetical protein [Planctomycetaceae bacterium]